MIENVAAASQDRVVGLMAELKSAYRGFQWESVLWARDGSRRSPYRTLVLFGLSARTRDSLLVEYCQEFFRIFPSHQDLADAGESLRQAVGSVVRPGQLPFVESMAETLGGGTPRDRDGLLRIHGVGEKIAECVMAYGWGDDALPLDANCVRVLARVFALDGSARTPSTLRQGLKCVYLGNAKSFSQLSIGMIDIHEILRLHGQVCCTRSPDCAVCPVSGCASRRRPQDRSGPVAALDGIWDGWRELINEPSAI